MSISWAIVVDASDTDFELEDEVEVSTSFEIMKSFTDVPVRTKYGNPQE